MSVGTAFYPREAELNSQLAWGEWSGYHSAAVYADFHDIEYNAIREAAAVIDVSPLYKYVVSGPDAPRLIDRVMTRDVSKLQVDQVYYTPWCDEDGKMIDDGTLTRLSETGVPGHRRRSRATLVPDERGRPGRRGRGHQRRTAGLALQGRLSRDVLEAATGQDWTDVRVLPPARVARSRASTVDVTRTGYTGDLGYELWMPADGALAVWDRALRGRTALRDPPGRHPRAGRLARGGRPDPDRGRVLQRAARPRRRAALLARSSSASGGWSTSARRRPSTASARCSRSSEPAARRGGWWAWSSTGPASRGCSRSTAWRPRSRRWCTATRCRSTARAARSGARRASPGGRRSRRWSASAPSTSFEKPGTRLSVEWSVEGERGKVAATVVPMPFLDLERKRT